MQSFLRHVQVLTSDSAAAAAYGDPRATRESEGAPLGNLDTLIVSHALATDSTLVSTDKALASIPGLLVEHWTPASAER